MRPATVDDDDTGRGLNFLCIDNHRAINNLPELVTSIDVILLARSKKKLISWALATLGFWVEMMEFFFLFFSELRVCYKKMKEKRKQLLFYIR